MVFEMCARYITIFCFLSTVRAWSISPTLMISSVRAHGAYDKTMVRSLLDYCVSVWVSYKKGDIEVLEKVQKKATKIIPEIKTFAIQGSS